jgi:hypothetical protein
MADVELELARALWAFRPGDLVEGLWELLADWDADPRLELGLAAHQLREVLAGEHLVARQPQLGAPPRIRPAVPRRAVPDPGA